MARASIPSTSRVNLTKSCILFHFYIKPQQHILPNISFSVVSYSISTSNHNHVRSIKHAFRLYLIPFLHQTTTYGGPDFATPLLYLIPFLHQTTTETLTLCPNGRLYLIPFLHQTTTSCCCKKNTSMLYLIPFLHQTTTSLY